MNIHLHRVAGSNDREGHDSKQRVRRGRRAEQNSGRRTAVLPLPRHIDERGGQFVLLKEIQRMKRTEPPDTWRRDSVEV